MNKYKCPHCGKITPRKSTKAWIKSFCESLGKNVRLQIIKKPSELAQKALDAVVPPELLKTETGQALKKAQADFRKGLIKEETLLAAHERLRTALIMNLGMAPNRRSFRH